MTSAELSKMYQIKGRIGSGTGGLVILAYQINLRRYVVLKQILNPSIDEEANRMEANLLKKLKSRYLPAVYDYLEVDGKFFTVMEFIDGRSLEKILESGENFGLLQLRQMGMDIASALSELHRQEKPILHLDVKPANIMIRKNGDAVLIDLNASMEGNSAEGIGGTPDYCSPEQKRVFEQFQAHGSMPGFRALSPRSDIYSLGVTLYHAAMGKIYTPEDPQWDGLAAKTSEEFMEILKKALAQKPEDRYESAEQMKEDLSVMEESSSRIRKWRKTVKTLKTLCTAGLVFFIALGAFSVYLIVQDGKDQYDHLTTAMTEQIRNGQYAQAQETYQKAKEVSSSKGYADLLRSDMLIAQGKYAENEQYLADTVLQMDDITKNSNYLAQALKNLAESQFALGEYEPAAQNYASAYELQEDDAALARDYAITLAYLGNFDQANTVLEQAQAGGLTSGDLVLAQSEIQHAMGNTAQAIEQLEALKMETADPAMQYQIYCRLPDWKMEVGEYEKAAGLLEEATEKLPEAYGLRMRQRLVHVYSRLASNSPDKKYLQKEADLLQEIVNQNYASYQDLNNLAVVNQKLGRFDEVEKNIARMEEVQPGHYNNAKRRAFLELDRQLAAPVTAREFHTFDQYYQQAFAQYDSSTGDTEMDLLETQHEEVENGGWLE